MTSPSNLKSVLIGLLAPGDGGAPAMLSPGDWREIERLASIHRLGPLLHYRQSDNRTVPESVRQRWHDSFRAAAFDALRCSAELSGVIGLLDRGGFAPIALKGAWLAWHAYPHPALRPMRDIDLWLPSDSIISAYRLLQANGFSATASPQLSLEQAVQLDKHLPPLRSRGGVYVELHHRLWEIGGRMDHAAPVADLADLRARAIRAGKVAYLAPQDTLAHLIIHAVYDHRLDCGPLLLSDVEFLVSHSEIDWDAFWREAELGGWLRGAALVIQMVRSHAPHLPVPEVPLPCGAQAGLAAELLLQNLDTRQSAGVVATFSAAGLRPFLRRVLARRGTGSHWGVGRDLTGEGGFTAWAGKRLARTLRELVRSDVRSQAAALTRLSRWLDA
jgi:hypothetical protein